MILVHMYIMYLNIRAPASDFGVENPPSSRHSENWNWELRIEIQSQIFKFFFFRDFKKTQPNNSFYYCPSIRLAGLLNFNSGFFRR